jgi:outer membrane biosynthesis protein TonB
MRKLLTLAIPMLLGVGVLTAAIHGDPQSGEQTKRLQAGVAATRSLPAVIEEAAAAVPATTATTAAPATTTTTAAPATTTTAAPTTTTTAKPRSTTTTAPPRPRPTTTTGPAQSQAAAPQPQPQVIDCGTGSASAKANLVNLGSGRYGLTATVLNESTKAIELDGLVVTADYGAAGKKQFTVSVTGKRIDARPGQAEVTFSIPESEGTSAPSNFVISDFRFHTAGLPECTSH